jgi:16S rRNA (cytidine1402-2'-O)-methyltransferase
MSDPGTLYVVPTPIGNLEDITLRALRVLREVPTIACEDTRVTSFLLKHFEIPQKRLISYFAGNEAARVGSIVATLLGGEDVALVSDAGTPGISDPGARLISAAIGEGIRVVPLPGPTAAIAAVIASGLPTDSILFEGFLPHKKGRQTMLRSLARESRTIVLYESPHRIVKTLRELAEHLGEERRAVVCRELTKLHEEIGRGALGELRDDYAGRASIRGELVVVIDGRRKERKGRDRDAAESSMEEMDDDE